MESKPRYDHAAVLCLLERLKRKPRNSKQVHRRMRQYLGKRGKA